MVTIKNPTNEVQYIEVFAPNKPGERDTVTVMPRGRVTLAPHLRVSPTANRLTVEVTGNDAPVSPLNFGA